MNFKILLMGLLLISVQGCATLTSSEMQTVALTTQSDEGTLLEDANCVLKNDRGEWQATAPAEVRVRRSAEDLIVTCTRQGLPDGLLRAISRASNGMLGNIIMIGGGIGALIDHSTGKGYDYADDLPVTMGAVVIVDRHNAPEPTSQADKSRTSDLPINVGSPNDRQSLAARPR